MIQILFKISAGQRLIASKIKYFLNIYMHMYGRGLGPSNNKK